VSDDKLLADIAAYKLAQASTGYPLIWANKATPKLDQTTLIRGLIMPESMIVTYGESNSGKTFHAVERDLLLAAGQTWYDRETEPGFVLYVAAEGPHSVERRVHAYMRERLSEFERVPFAILPRALDLLRPDADTPALIDFIKQTEDALGLPCKKVTADTLARVIAGGNENSSEDMGAAVRNADLIRHEIASAFAELPEKEPFGAPIVCPAKHHEGRSETPEARTICG